MKPRLYDELVPWYRLIDPYLDHADEVASYIAAFDRATPSATTLLELGSGAGHNAYHLKRRYACTLSDPSEPMLALSRELNPECEHVLGDMRTLRLERTFDVVLVHDAVMYMTTEADLAAAIETAYAHTRRGGAMVITPDLVKDTFEESTFAFGSSEGTRAAQCLEWCWDPDPGDETFTVEYAFLLRDGNEVTAVHDRHVEGLFTRETWRRVLTRAGFTVETFPRPIDDDTFDDVFLCRRP